MAPRPTTSTPPSQRDRLGRLLLECNGIKLRPDRGRNGRNFKGWSAKGEAHFTWSENDRKDIRERLDRIVRSGPFVQSWRPLAFLEYIVHETLAGRGERLKGYRVAFAVFGRPETFDPVADPIMRIDAGRRREKSPQQIGRRLSIVPPDDGGLFDPFLHREASACR